MEIQSDDADGFAQRVELLLNSGYPFAIFSLPGERLIYTVADDGVSKIKSSKVFGITDWHNNHYEIIDRDVNIVTGRNSTNSFLTGNFPHRGTTDWADYLKALKSIITALERSDSKIVMSKQLTAANPFDDLKIFGNALHSLFSAYPNAFRAVYYTHATGAWCVCSPELLLDYDKGKNEIKTIALAGTRSADSVSSWDNKNIREHNFVVRHIENTLLSLDLSPELSETETMTTGSLQHLMTRFKCPLKDITLKTVLAKLHPTPAICGYPVDWAYDIINQEEKHNRECYGGYISYEDDNKFISHVNLRCFAFTPSQITFFGGGGILPDSDPEKEWEEASAKINATMSHLGL